MSVIQCIFIDTVLFKMLLASKCWDGCIMKPKVSFWCWKDVESMKPGHNIVLVAQNAIKKLKMSPK